MVLGRHFMHMVWIVPGFQFEAVFVHSDPSHELGLGLGSADSP